MLHVINDEDTLENWLIEDAVNGGTVAIVPKGPTEAIKERQRRRAVCMSVAEEMLDVLKALTADIREGQIARLLPFNPESFGLLKYADQAIAKASGEPVSP